MHFRTSPRLLLVISLLVSILGVNTPARAAAIDNPILFVTQVPLAAGFTGLVSAFGNHLGDIANSGRGGDLWIWYPDGTMKNLTAAAGYGLDGNSDGMLTGQEAIGVRDPSVHWSGAKALFSMVIGAPTAQYQVESYYWQIYEITGLGKDDSPVITKVLNQPENFNNVTPIYGSDDRIIFTSDRPRNGSLLLYPQLDEYELAPTVSGIWSLDPANGDLRLLNHAPSGDFTPTIDSYGRVVFTQWDHLQRDQQADADQEKDHPGSTDCGSARYGTFNYESETSTVYHLNDRREVFPEPRACRTDLLAGTNLMGHNFNHFFPWTINQDGSTSELLNHMGRHEFGVYIEKAIKDDPNVMEFYGQYGHTENQNNIRTGVFQIKEDPNQPGSYFGVDAPEFGTHASGNIVRIHAPLGLNADYIVIDYITHPDTYLTTSTPNHSGRYRDPVMLSNGTLIAAHSPYVGEEDGSDLDSAYSFRIKTLSMGGNGYYAADPVLTSGIEKSISYWDPDKLVSYSGPLWELSPVEVRPRVAPGIAIAAALDGAEQSMFDQAGVDVTQFKNWLAENQLALVVGRNITTRDDIDKQQPYNLRVPSGVQTIGAGGKIYDVTHIQFFQGDQLRGLTGCCGTVPNAGRRVIAQVMHEMNALAAMPYSNGPAGSVNLATDGSYAALVPSQRAMSWQLTNGNTAVVRERYWVTFQSGEIRVCTSCHGLNEYDQAGNLTPQNPPQALLALLNYWKGSQNLQTLTLTSTASQDGWILESTETSGVGGKLNANSTTFNLGDDAANRQFRAVLSFDTASIPDNAVITSVTLRFQYVGKAGTLPFNTHGNLLVDIRTGSFGNNPALQLGDFKAPASKNKILAYTNLKVDNWYSQTLSPADFRFINLTGATEFRLRFARDDNNDRGADLLKIFSGNDVDASNHPQLIITYYIP